MLGAAMSAGSFVMLLVFSKNFGDRLATKTTGAVRADMDIGMILALVGLAVAAGLGFYLARDTTAGKNGTITPGTPT